MKSDPDHVKTLAEIGWTLCPHKIQEIDITGSCHILIITRSDIQAALFRLDTLGETAIVARCPTCEAYNFRHQSRTLKATMNKDNSITVGCTTLSRTLVAEIRKWAGATSYIQSPYLT